MDWFRHYHGMCTDPKLHKASRVAKVRRSVAIAAWCAVLESASQSAERGSLSGFDASDLAFLIDEPAGVAERIMAAFLTLGMIRDESVSAWSRRQKNSDDVKIRVKRHRDKSAKPMNAHDIDSGGNVTETHRTEQNRTEKKESPPGEGAQAPELAKAALWREMKSQVGGSHAGSLVGKWVKLYGIGQVSDAHYAAMANMPADYVEWMAKRLQANGKSYAARAPHGGKSYHQNVTESLIDDDEREFEALPRLFGEASILCPGRADYDA